MAWPTVRCHVAAAGHDCGSSCSCGCRSPRPIAAAAHPPNQQNKETMSSSSALSNLTAALSVSPLPSRWRRPAANNGMCSLSVRAMGGDARDNLDHLQRATGKHQQQVSQQPKRRATPSPPLGLWDRFPTARTIQQMMDTMDRIIEDPLAYSAERAASLPLFTNGDTVGTGGSYRRGRTPWEIKESEGEYKLRFDMPGMTKQDVKLWVEEKMLVIKAEKPAKKVGEEEEEEWPASSYGKYNSRIALPDSVEVDKIKAEVKDGVLYITIPKVPASAKILDIAVQ